LEEEEEDDADDGCLLQCRNVLILLLELFPMEVFLDFPLT
jgi:hypothetical protein